MKKNKDLFDIIKVGDIIRNKKDNQLYRVEGFYDNKYGATLVNVDKKYPCQVCSSIINKEYEFVTSYDPVNNPQHYTNGNIECIDAMISAYGKEAVMDFCKCNAFKYQWRFDKKNGVEDIKKAQWYQNKYIELSNDK